LECVKNGRPNQLVSDDRGVRGGQRLATAEKQGLFRLSVQNTLDGTFVPPIVTGDPLYAPDTAAEHHG
jgi:hypothetical protein